LHLAHEVARLVIAHPRPGFSAHPLQVVDRKVARFGLHQPMALARAHPADNSVLNRNVSRSVHNASIGTSQASTRSDGTCCTEKAAPTSHGGAGVPCRSAQVRSYQ